MEVKFKEYHKMRRFMDGTLYKILSKLNLVGKFSSPIILSCEIIDKQELKLSKLTNRGRYKLLPNIISKVINVRNNLEKRIKLLDVEYILLGIEFTSEGMYEF